MNRRTLIIIAVAAVAVLGLAVWGFSRRAAAPDITYRTADVERVSLRRTVSATGTVQPLTVVDIKSRAGGEVKLLAAEVGDLVKPGDLIARIDPTDSQTAFNQAAADVSAARARVGQTSQTRDLQRLTVATGIAEAEAQVRAAQSRYIQAQKQSAAQPTLTETAIRQARASLESAEQQLTQLRSAGDPQARTEARTALASAEASLRNAENDLKRQEQLYAKGFVALAAVDSARTQRDVARAQAESARTRQETVGGNQDAAIRVAQARVSEARASLRAAEAQRVQNGLRRQDVANAAAAVAQAKAGLDAARANARQIGIRAADIEQARAQIARSQASLRNASVQLESTTIRAPRRGVILQKYVEQGTIITSGQSLNSPGTSIVQIGDLSRVFVEASVDEADIAQIKVGQKVKVTLDAYPEDEFEGRVRRIDPRGTTDQNVTTVKTKVEIMKPDARLRPGLNAECEFVIAEKKDVIAIPPRAVKQEKGKKSVEVLVAGKPEKRDIDTGLETNDMVEVASGLSEGDKVITQTIRPGDEASSGRGSGGGRRGGPGGSGSGSGSGGRPGGFGNFSR